MIFENVPNSKEILEQQRAIDDLLIFIKCEKEARHLLLKVDCL